jgi:hypothetical protein
MGVRSCRLPAAVLLGLLLPGPTGCAIGVQSPELHEPTAPVARTKARAQLKVHLKSGGLLVLDDWKLSPDGGRLSGTGQAYGVTREPNGGKGRQDVAVADVAVLETTSSETIFSLGMGVMATTTAVLGGMTLYCVASPKSCFGSCPTFYVEGAGGRPGEPDRPQAEGFSASIARVLEARDLDALGLARPGGSRVSLTMRNEALETHAVRRVRLLAAARPAGGRVLAGADGALHPAPALAPPLACRAPEGDCLEALRADDGRDRASAADPSDLATREEVDLVFPAARGRSGIAIAARQTLLSTFLFYQSMAYVGRGAGDFLAALERGGPDAGRRAMGMARLLGGIDVEVAEGGSPWRSIGGFDEPGPIAGDVQVVPFEGAGEGPLRVRLRLAKGHWRLGSVALAPLGEPVTPLRVEPEAVEHDGRRDDEARRRLKEGDGHLVTRPGDAYRLVFRLPPSDLPLELFLESEGYYYEWMRQEWLADEDPRMAALVLGDPAEALRRLAPVYKAHEGGLEQAFWASRFRK